MQRVLLFWVLAGTLTGPGVCAAGGVKITGPVIELVPPTYDFGLLPQETVRKAEITIRNSGTEELQIYEVSSDCGCTVAQLPDSSLAPGDSTRMRVVLSTRHYTGSLTKHVFLKTNDPGAPKARLNLKAFIRALVSVRPSSLDFGSLARGETPTRTLTLTAAGDDSLRIGEIHLPLETFNVRREQKTVGDSTVYRLHVQVRPDAPLGPFSATASIQTNLKGLRDLKVNVSGLIHGFFKVEPPRLPLGQIRQGAVRQRWVQLEAQREGLHRVLSASCSNQHLGVQIQPIEEGRIYRIVVTVGADAPAERIRGTLLVHTDDPDQPEIRIPVQGNVRAREEGE
jgi:hypothetical protein